MTIDTSGQVTIRKSMMSTNRSDGGAVNTDLQQGLCKATMGKFR